jgi:hypothetical protein
MKLLDLDPHWVLIHRWDDASGTQHFPPYCPEGPERRIGGISFMCPVHTKRCEYCQQLLPESHRLVVWFENPVDGLPPEFTATHRWQRTGETFETMTLTPSINAQGEYPGCWHGHITNGEIQ